MGSSLRVFFGAAALCLALPAFALAAASPAAGPAAVPGGASWTAPTPAEGARYEVAVFEI